jgi:peptide/nickel transport system substrate-binding protein
MQVGFNLGKGVEGMPGAAEIQDPKVRFAMQYALTFPASAVSCLVPNARA